MSLSRAMPTAALLVACLAGVSPAREDGRTVELDSAKNARLFYSHFGRYGYRPGQLITHGGGALRFLLRTQAKAVNETGLYSYFALAGDFQVSAAYTLISLPAPESGRGACVGFTADTKGPGGSVSLVRGHWPSWGSGYLVTRWRPSADGPVEHDTSFYPTHAKKGGLVLRREKGEAVALVTEGSGEPPHELCRVPFTEDTVRHLRLHADPGNSQAALDVRLGGLFVRAEEITGGIPQKEAGGGWSWWVVGAAAGGAAGLALLIIYGKWRKARAA